MTKFKRSIPALPVVNIDKAITFYESKMGFKTRVQKDGFASMVRDGIEIQLWQACDRSWKYKFWLFLNPITNGAESFLAGTASCRIEVEGIDDLYLEYKATGIIYDSYTVVEDQPWGHRDFPILDLHGNLITFFEIVH
ncbi:VOC family protein [Mucilaginibacter sp. 14171R-50]|uniref:bleomycin resistance protein n=1 Tax=Mucilaginibacter sp. 14171R-50 TaxID=2703789 RepID=UPI00138B4078|nr:VOC family protein [Mucilaginibacter sp. 14171R-50]QHS55180.1 VOC family protein [Mucilaginibacter sp. 14171R-50]